MEGVIYIKFLHKDDIYAINSSYGLVGEFEPPVVCERCGENIYIPVQFSNITIIQPMGDVIKPLPTEIPYLTLRTELELPMLEVSRNITYTEKQRLKRFPSICSIDDNSFEMLINDFNHRPVKHICSDRKND